ncbi:MAG: flavodoxin family protein [Desulfobacteraceae bacterium]|nr:MAG: flavodoxin family protein [Desulfobacteraceae bacterium]
MPKPTRITAIIGSYRKGGVNDTAVDEILGAAAEKGAKVTKIYLIDRRVSFCTNCRTCMQDEDPQRGECVLPDEMAEILNALEQSDAIVMACPMNFGTVTALMKRFIERLACFAYWPWGMRAPKVRNSARPRRAVVVASSAAPALVSRNSSRMVGLLKNAAGMLGARTVGVLFIGQAAGRPEPELSARIRKKARMLGMKLAAGE